MNNTFLHVDMDAFFASVEQHDNPALRGKPVIVGSPADRRGVVAAASYEVREFGVHSAMPSGEAARRCPNAIFVPPNMKRYKEVSCRVFEIFERFTPLVEPLSIDEAFLDVTGSLKLFGSGVEIGEKIRAMIFAEIGITASVGVAPNKFLAKLASDMDKPNGLTKVPFSREDVIAFLEPLHVSRIWGVGAVTQKNFESKGIKSVGDLQRISIQKLISIVGEHSANHFKLLAYGEDAREIVTNEAEKSISKEHTFPKDVKSFEALERALFDLTDEVGEQLRAKGKYAGVIRLKLRWRGFKTITRQRQMRPPCCDAFSLRGAALALLKNEKISRPVRLIGIGVSGLCDRKTEQLSLFGDDMENREKRERLSHSMDTLQAKFGEKAVKRAKSGGED